MTYAPLRFKNCINPALLDTGAVQIATSKNELRKVQYAHPEALLKELPAPEFKIRITNGTLVTVKKQVVLRFFLSGRVFDEKFLILLTMGTVLKGISIF